MKPISIILFFFLCVLQAAAQNWTCFPANQKSYYQFNSWYGPVIDLIVQDSAKLNGSESTLYFKRKIQNPGAESCRNEIFQFYEATNYDPYFLDSLRINADTTFYLDQGYNIYFLPNAQVGQSWSFSTFGSITISCDSIIAENIFGQADSVKYFHTSGAMLTQQIRLSKHYGFLDFVPFYNYSNSTAIVPYHLIGIQDSVGQLGFRLPQFLDYLPYHAGDILKWDYHHDGMLWLPTYHFTFRDSITLVSVFPDSLIYTYDRVQVDSGNHISYLYGQIRIFTRDNFGNLLDSPPNDIGISESNQGPNYPALYRSLPCQIGQDTVLFNEWIERSFQWDHRFIFSDTSCVIVDAVDGISDHYSFNTHQGLVKEWYYGQSANWLYTLIGARINGIVYGNPSLTVGISQMKIASIKIYPNPCTEILIISISAGKFRRAELLDMCGRVLLSMDLIEGDSVLDVSALPKGFYLLRLEGDRSVMEKIIKQ